MAGDNVINQHYVSQGYLRNFGERNFIWAFDKLKRNKFRSNVRNVASERYFYDSEELARITGERQFIEKRLGKIEDKYNPVMDDLFERLGDPHFVLDDETRGFLSVFMAIQMCRTKESLAQSSQMIEATLNVMKEACLKADIPLPREYELNAEQSAQDSFKKSLVSPDQIENYALILNTHIWVIKRAAPNEVFLTSDHPFAKRPHITGSWRSMSGIASKGIEIAFPLSSKYLLSLYDAEHFHRLIAFNGTVRSDLNHENMIYYNQFQVKDSNRFVFSEVDDFSFVEFLLNDQPELANPNRKRVEAT